MAKLKAVLTGDFIRSSAAEEKSLLLAMSALEDCAEGAQAEFDRHRGDGWQIYLRRPHGTLRLTLRILARLKSGKSGLQTRISIGIGPASVSQGDLAASSGAAFERSGRGLDQMPSRQRLAIAGDGITPLHGAVLILSEEIANRWSPEQARAVLEVIGPVPRTGRPTQRAIADRLGITRQAVQERLSRAGYNALITALESWEAEND